MKTLRPLFVTLACFLFLATAAGCATLDKLYNKQVTTEPRQTVTVQTNAVIISEARPVISWETNILWQTNLAGQPSAIGTVTPTATNFFPVLVTNLVPVFFTNQTLVLVTNLVERPGAQATIDAAGSIANTILPGIGSIVALALGGLYHGYRQIRNRKTNEALAQGIETARQVLSSTTAGQQADAAFVHWLVGHQQEAGVLGSVANLVQNVDNPAAKEAAAEILARIRASQTPPTVAPMPAPPPPPA